jgi:transposase
VVAELVEQVGVGVLTAMVFLTELGDMKRFRNRRQLASYLGLAPCSHESGEVSDRKGHITRQGPSRVRKVLCQAVWAGLRWGSPDATWFQAYVRQHPRRRKVAAEGVMRRLAIRLWHRARDFTNVPHPDASMPDSAGGPCRRAGALIAAPCTPG